MASLATYAYADMYYIHIAHFLKVGEPLISKTIDDSSFCKLVNQIIIKCIQKRETVEQLFQKKLRDWIMKPNWLAIRGIVC